MVVYIYVEVVDVGICVEVVVKVVRDVKAEGAPIVIVRWVTPIQEQALE